MTNKPNKLCIIGASLILYFFSIPFAFTQPGSLIVNQDERVERLVNSHIDLNEKMLGIPGYRIQIFFASGNDSKARAYAVKSEVLKNVAGQTVYILFEAPYYKVRVGDFRTRLDAERELQHIRPVYPGAFIVEDAIALPVLKSDGF